MNGLQKRLIEILLENDARFSAQYLANRTGVSSKTVRSSLRLAESELEQEGLQLTAKKGTGYRIVESVPGAAEMMRQRMNLQFSAASLVTNNERSHFVLRCILAGKTIKSVEEISSLFYINSTSAKQVLNTCRHICSMFELRLQFHRNRGFSISGEEANIRRCIVYEESYALVFHDNRDAAFLELTGYGTQRRQLIRDSILQYQAEFEPYNLSAYSIEYLSALLYAGAVRNEAGCYLTMSPDIENVFSNRNTYYVASNIIAEIRSELNAKYTQEDTYLVGMALVALRVTLDESSHQRFFYRHNKDIALDIVRNIAKMNQFSSLMKDLELIDIFAMNIESIMTRSKYHFLTSQIVRQGIPSCSQMSMRMAVQAAVYLQEQYGLTISREDVIHISTMIHPIFGRYHWVFPRDKACVVSGFDKITGVGIKERLLRNFSKYLEDVEVLEPYELTSRRSEQYSLVFTDIPGFQPSSSKQMAVIPVTLNMDEADKIRIRRILISRTEASNQNGAWREMLHIQDGLEAKNQEDILRKIEEVINEFSGEEQDIYGDLERCRQFNPFIPVNNSVMITGAVNHTGVTSIFFFLLKKPVDWDGVAKVKVIIYWDRGMRAEDGRMFENEWVPHTIDRFRRDPERMERFLRNPTVEMIEEEVLQMSDETTAVSCSFR